MSEEFSKDYLPGITVDPNMRDFSKSPFVIKKVERASATIAKYGLPKEDTPTKKGKRELSFNHTGETSQGKTSII